MLCMLLMESPGYDTIEKYLLHVLPNPLMIVVHRAIDADRGEPIVVGLAVIPALVE